VAVRRNLENAVVATLEGRGEAVLALDRGLQTGGLREVVSLSAVGDLDVHPCPPLSEIALMMQPPAASVKPGVSPPRNIA